MRKSESGLFDKIGRFHSNLPGLWEWECYDREEVI